jgi:excisionase family DNA binding protein
MTVKEAAKRLGLAPATVYALVSGKKIAHYRHGSRIQISEEDLETYRRKCRVEAGEEQPAAPPPRSTRREPRLKRLVLD